MVLLLFWVGMVDPAVVFFPAKFDLASGKREIFGVRQFCPFYILKSVFRICHNKFKWLDGNIKCAVEHVVEVQSEFFEIWLLLFYAPIFRIRCRWTGCNAVSLFEAGREGDPFMMRQSIYPF